MIKSTAILSMMLILSASQSLSANVLHVIIMAGQSNMVGGASVNEVSLELVSMIDPMTDVPMRQWINGAEYDDLKWNAHLAPRHTGFGPEMGLAHRIRAARPDHDFAIIKIAQNGSGLECAWNPEGCGIRLYQKLRVLTDRWMDELRTDGVDCRLAGLIWVQGESDARSDFNSQNYGENLHAFMSSLRRDLRRARLPCVVARVHPRSEEYLFGNAVRAGMIALDAQDPLMSSIGISDLPLKEDQVHLSSDSMIRIGCRTADALLALGALDDDTAVRPCQGDLDGDGAVTISDVLELLGSWEACSP